MKRCKPILELLLTLRRQCLKVGIALEFLFLFLKGKVSIIAQPLAPVGTGTFGSPCTSIAGRSLQAGGIIILLRLALLGENHRRR